MSSPTGQMGVIGNRAASRPVRRPRSQVIQRPSIETLTYTQSRNGNVTTVTVTSSLSGTVYYHWYLDGTWVAVTTTNHYSFMLLPGEQARVEVLVSNDAGFDFVANTPPDATGSRVTLWWIRSADTDVREYKVEQNQDSGGWSQIATVPYLPSAWDYRVTSPRLDDLSSYEWRVTPVDLAGNDGTVTALDARTVVRTPDATDFTIAFDEGTTRVTFAEAA